MATAVAEPLPAVAQAKAAETSTGLPEESVQELDSSPYTLLSQGAEARVWSSTYMGRPAVIKERFRKQYRHPALDARLTASRLKGEVRSLLKARKLGVRTPVAYAVDMPTGCIYMERVPGESVKALLRGGEGEGEGGAANPLADPAARDAALRAIGRAVAKLHDGGLIHGDLTTSNMLLRPDGELVLIDFGLAYNSGLPEDKGVDLYVLERAFASAHAGDAAQLFQTVLEAYRRASRMWSATLNRFAEVRMRGRKRSMVG